MNKHNSGASKATAKKSKNTDKKVVQDELTSFDVRQAAQDAKKTFDTFVITGKLPITK